MYTGPEQEIAAIRLLLERVSDPEIPVLSVIDLGIVRKIELGKSGDEQGRTGIQPSKSAVTVTITPTYSGCPAIEVIGRDILRVLREHGYTDARILTGLSPAWTTDWMSEKGKEQLKAYGIAAPLPVQQVCTTRLFREEEAIACPRCNSYDTKLVSWFGSTPCKALYQCRACQEPFDYFKCH